MGEPIEYEGRVTALASAVFTHGAPALVTGDEKGAVRTGNLGPW